MKVRRLPAHDLVLDGEESAVYVGDSVVVLSPISTTVLTALHEDVWSPATDIAAVVVNRYGDPPEGSVLDAIRTVVDELAGLGLVERDG